MAETPKTFDQWAIVEIMGHDRYAGRVTEETIGGCAFVRIDVPEANGAAAFTKLFGQGAIFSITPVAEEIARKAAERMRSQPVNVYGLLAAPRNDEVFADEDPDDDDLEPEAFGPDYLQQN